MSKPVTPADDLEVEMTVLTDDQNITLQTILQALVDLPGVALQVNSYFLGAGIDNPGEDIAELADIAYGR